VAVGEERPSCAIGLFRHSSRFARKWARKNKLVLGSHRAGGTQYLWRRSQGLGLRLPEEEEAAVDPGRAGRRSGASSPISGPRSRGSGRPGLQGRYRISAIEGIRGTH
jgi:hypothetical protein